MTATTGAEGLPAPRRARRPECEGGAGPLQPLRPGRRPSRRRGAPMSAGRERRIGGNAVAVCERALVVRPAGSRSPRAERARRGCRRQNVSAESVPLDGVAGDRFECGHEADAHGEAILGGLLEAAHDHGVERVGYVGAEHRVERGVSVKMLAQSASAPAANGSCRSEARRA